MAGGNVSVRGRRRELDVSEENEANTTPKRRKLEVDVESRHYKKKSLCRQQNLLEIRRSS